MNMDWNEFYQTLGAAEDFVKSFEPYKDELLSNATDEFPFFMERDFYTQYYPLCGRNDCEKVFAEMEKVADIVRKNPIAARYANMIHYALYCRKELLWQVQWLSTEKIFGENEGIFNLFIALSVLPKVRNKHIELGLDEKFMYGMAKWISAFTDIYAVAHNGCTGHPLSNLYWLRFSVTGELFRIGRLEYLPRPWFADFPHIYRSCKTGKFVVLCRNGWAFDKNHLRVEPESSETVFRTELVIENGKVTGTAVNPSGLPETEAEVTLDLTEWELFVKDGEEVMTLHIPGGEQMTYDSIKSSLAEAKKFYKTVFNKDIKIFCCNSWIFNPVWQKELPNSNIAEWQRNSFMTPPFIADGISGLFFVYGERECDPRQKTCVTSLHRAFCRIFDRGEKLRQGAMFIPGDDV